jgi:hypothetical protein
MFAELELSINRALTSLSAPTNGDLFEKAGPAEK